MERIEYKNIEGDFRAIEVYGDNIFIGTTESIYLSPDNGETWHEINDDGIKLSVNSLLISGSKIYAAVIGGVYEADLEEFNLSGVNEVEDINYLYANEPYPNPAKSSVRVEIFWAIGNPVTEDEIKIYDLYGEEIKTKGRLELKRLNSYKGYLEWNCSNVNKGIYLVRIDHGLRSVTLIVVKY